MPSRVAQALAGYRPYYQTVPASGLTAPYAGIVCCMASTSGGGLDGSESKGGAREGVTINGVTHEVSTNGGHSSGTNTASFPVNAGDVVRYYHWHYGDGWSASNTIVYLGLMPL